MQKYKAILVVFFIFFCSMHSFCADSLKDVINIVSSVQAISEEERAVLIKDAINKNIQEIIKKAEIQYDFEREKYRNIKLDISNCVMYSGIFFGVIAGIFCCLKKGQ